MRGLSCGFDLVDVQTSLRSIYQTQISTVAFVKSSHLISPFSGAFRRTYGVRKGVSPPRSTVQSSWSPDQLWRPAERLFPGNGSSSSSFLMNPETSISMISGIEGLGSELELFLELVPVRMRNALACHEEIGDLIEVVLDFGRKPLARFPSGDWVISNEPVKREDLRYAISKAV